MNPVWHFMINPFSGSEPLCGSYSGSPCGITLEAGDVTCPECLAQMDSPKMRDSETRRVALQAQAEREWRQSNPAAARLYDRLRRS